MDIGIDPARLREALIYLLIIISSLALHEWGHARMADRLGDPTPRSQGRVTLNPLAHIDLIGTVLIPFMGTIGLFGGFGMIGWAKPVWTDPSYFRRGNFDRALVTLAGPAVNLVLAVAMTVASATAHRLGAPIEELFDKILSVNVGLLVFNLLPIPPLDGSKFWMYWFGMSEETYARLSAWGPLALMIMVNVPAGKELLRLIYIKGFIPFDLLHRALT